jgi:hypothetical protein
MKSQSIIVNAKTSTLVGALASLSLTQPSNHVPRRASSILGFKTHNGCFTLWIFKAITIVDGIQEVNGQQDNAYNNGESEKAAPRTNCEKKFAIAVETKLEAFYLKHLNLSSHIHANRRRKTYQMIATSCLVKINNHHMRLAVRRINRFRDVADRIGVHISTTISSQIGCIVIDRSSRLA